MRVPTLEGSPGPGERGDPQLPDPRQRFTGPPLKGSALRTSESAPHPEAETSGQSPVTGNKHFKKSHLKATF